MDQEFICFHEEALRDAVCQMGGPFTYNGAEYLGVISAMELSTEFEAEGGGLWEVLGTQITVAKSALPVAPVAGETLYIGSQKARIKKVSSDEVSYELVCATATK